MLKKEITISNFHDFYENPFAELVQSACSFDSNIYLTYKNQNVNAKSIMGILAFQANAGDSVIITADGADAEASVTAIENFLTCQRP